jgi:hypothetical protein
MQPPALPTPGQNRVCRECGQLALISESIELNGLVVCAACKPSAIAKLASGRSLGLGGVWRSKKLFITGLNSALPDRCVKCNESSQGFLLKRKLYWHPSWVYIFVAVSPIIYVLVSLIVRKNATIHIGLCDAHRRKRWIAIAAGWGLTFASLVMFIAAGSISNKSSGVFFLGGILVLLVGIFWGLFGSRAVHARLINTEFVHVGGAKRPFLDSLPEWTA